MAENARISGKNEAACSETTVEIKIKTLDSQTYTLRVDKCVPVPALKQQIASVTGVLSEQQRLICRGKVLKDDQLLSAYHVEDGHTLHLVVRQPVIPSSEISPDAATDTAPSSGRSHRGPGVLVGSFNISEQDGAFPDLSRVVSAVLGSIGLTSVGGGGEGIDLNELPTERLSLSPGLSSLRISSRQTDLRRQPVPDSTPTSHPTIDLAESLQPPVIPDSLATLSQNLSRLRQEFISIAEEQGNTGQAAGSQERNGQNLDGTSYSSVQRGLPTPASLADVMLTTRQLLNEQAAECLRQLAESLRAQSNVSDASERTRIQSNALRLGIIFQNLGAVLLELGRTTMTLRMGETPADAVVNAGPAVFLSSNGPNPIMVQPLPFQPGTGLGAISGGTVQQSTGVSVGSGVLPRNIDIRIRTVGSFMSSSANRRESAAVQNNGQTAGQTAPATPNHVGGSGSFGNRESEVRVVPIRTVIAAVPASGSRSTSDQPSRGTMGIVYPVLARVQHLGSGNLVVTRAQGSDQPAANSVDLGGGGGESVPETLVQEENISIPGVDISSSSSLGEVTDGQGISSHIHNRLQQLLRTMFPGENVQVIGGGGIGGDRQGMDSNSGMGNLPAARSADNSPATAAASVEGAFLSNLLRQIMPIISENREADSSNTSPSESHNNNNNNNNNNGNRQDSEEDQENVDRGATSRSSSGNDPPSQPNPKRQRRN